jgi:ribosomal protein S18 acetylase RimI-like enzyme
MSAAPPPVSGAIEPLGAEHLEVLGAFFRSLPGGDLTFIKEDVTDRATLASWTVQTPGRQRWVALDETGAVAGFVAVLSLPGWSDHVGELRLVVDAGHRRQGWGRRLARHALAAAVSAGLSKVQVEVVAEQTGTLEMFERLGFTGEALLRDQVRDRSGSLRDLVVLAHFVQPTWEAMRGVGLTDEVGEP